jgi:eukaryotic-like serine/threonine-protein kinase
MHSGQPRAVACRLHRPESGRQTGGDIVDTAKLDPDRLYGVFQQLCEQPSAGWEAQLAEEFPTDPAARVELLAMLQAAADPPMTAPGIPGVLAEALRTLGRLPALQPGAEIAGWEVLGMLGEGGMGAVYRVRRADADCPQTGALKLGGAVDAENQARFVGEIRILAGLSHPGIARLIDSGVVHDRRFFVMELIEGEHIDRAAAGMPLQRRVDLLRQVGEVLAYAHRQLVVHRDLKPSNVMVEQTTAGMRVRLLDFGIARTLDATTQRTATGAAVLTLRYAAPEQLRGEHSGTAVDVHGFGLLAYEILSGRHPFSGGGPGEQVRALLEDTPWPLPAACRAAGAFDAEAALLAGDLDAIVQRALRKDPSTRYESMQAVVDDLAAWAAQRPVRARQGNAAYRMQRFLRRHWMASAASAVAIMALVVAGGVAVERASDAERARREAEQVADFFPALLRDMNPVTSERAVFAETSVLDLLTLAGERLHAADYPEQARARLMLEIADGLVRIGSPVRAIGLARSAAALADSPGLHVRAQRVEASALGADDTQAAETLLRRALAGLDADQASSVSPGILIDLAGLLSEGARDQEAAPLLRQAIVLLEALPESAPERVDLAVAHGRLAEVLETFGEHQSALENGLRALALSRERFGVAHPRHAAWLSSHAATLESLGRIDEAGDAHRQAIGVFERSLGPEHPSTLSARSNHALWLNRRGDHEGARAAFEALRASRERQSGPDSLAVADASQNLAATLERLGRHEEAGEAALVAVAIYDARLPATSFRPAYPRLTLASAALERGLAVEAERWSREAIERLDATLGSRSFPALSARGRLGQALLAQGNCTQGRRVLEDALQGLAGSTSPVVERQAQLIRDGLQRGCEQA